ncbi:MAG: glycosyltransferase family 2 protein [Alphaproteobacteria bacterium]
MPATLHRQHDSVEGERMHHENRGANLTIVVAALNEEVLIRSVVTEIIEAVEPRVAEYEIILVNDGSRDATGAIMDDMAKSSPRLRVVHNETNQGLGAIYRHGLGLARYEYYMLMCGDGGVPASSLPPMLDALGRADIVLPYVTNLRRIKSPMRFFASRCYTGLLNLMFRQKVKYYNGLPIHRTDLVRAIRVTSTGFAFQGEILIKLLKAGCTRFEVPIEGAERAGKSMALRPRNLLNVVSTLAKLSWAIFVFNSRSVAGRGAPENLRAGIPERDAGY